MKTIKKVSNLITLITIIGMFQACSNNDPQPETQEQQFLKQIAGSWKSEMVMLDGVDVTRSFPDLEIVFDEARTIAVTNPVPPIWKSNSTFAVVSNGNSFELERNDGLTITAESLQSKLTLSFQYDAATLSGRTGSVKGSFIFELRK